MSVFKIPVSNTPQRFEIELNHRTFIFSYSYNKFMQAWCFDLYTTEGEPVALNQPIITGSNILDQVKYLQIKGIFLPYTAGNPDAVPTLKGLGEESSLYFLQETTQY